MKKKILIISGGISKERIISLETGKQVARELKKNNYLVKTCEPDKDLLPVTKKFKPHYIFNALPFQNIPMSLNYSDILVFLLMLILIVSVSGILPFIFKIKNILVVKSE